MVAFYNVLSHFMALFKKNFNANMTGCKNYILLFQLLNQLCKCFHRF